MEDKHFKAFIRVVKSIRGYGDYDAWHFGDQNIVREPLIMAKDKDEVKKILIDKYPQFFPTAKVYSKETKDDAQFFYVIIYELYEWEKKQIIENTEWECAYCKQKHENTYLSKPRTYEKIFGDLMFCKSDEDHCLTEYKKEFYKDVDLPDDEWYIKKDSPNYIYKITEKVTGKCYVGKTKNAPFFRWWNHLTHSSSPFGIYLRQTKLSDWFFEVLEVLPSNVSDTEIFRIESDYIREYDSINNGYNSLISKKIKNGKD